MVKGCKIIMAAIALCFCLSIVQAGQLSIIPKPARMEIGKGEFVLKVDAGILVNSDLEEAYQVGRYLSDCLSPPTGMSLVTQRTSKVKPPAGSILLTTRNMGTELGEEGYELNVSAHGIILKASKPAGLFRGAQTIRQLFDPEILGRKKVKQKTWSIPVVRIVDEPRFPWRGSLLDSCRHFLTKDFVKRYIDILAMHKMNVLHWHLCEDQCWAIEIKKYPKLTEIGAWRGSGNNRHGGFYTQDDIREIVEYAKARHITIVPEIELPGHSMAALSAYPELSCTGGPFEVSMMRGVRKDVYCAGNEKVFEFLEDVLDEVIELFPSQYIHIGGDEVPKDRWEKCSKCQARIKAEGLKDEHELQSYFVKRIEKYLRSKNRRLIGWDEILEGGLAPDATVQSWRGMKGAIAAAKSGHDVIVSPTSHCYFDYPHDVTSLEKTYSLEPVPAELTAEQAKHILGGEGNMWTDRTDQVLVESWILPRMAALSEVLWSPKDDRDWQDFSNRMETQYKRYDEMGLRYFHGVPIKWVWEFIGGEIPVQGNEFVWDVTSHVRDLADAGAKDVYAIIVYDQGKNPVAIEQVSLLAGDKEIGRDKKVSIIGWPNPITSRRFDVSGIDKDKDFQIRVKMRGQGGSDSWVAVWLSSEPLPADIRWTGRKRLLKK